MKTRKLGWTDLNLTTIGLGTWAIGGGDWLFGWGPQDDAESLAAILRGIELGINWIDTAPAYGLGHGEEVVGQALKKLKRKPIVATAGLAVRESGRKSKPASSVWVLMSSTCTRYTGLIRNRNSNLPGSKLRIW